MSGFFPTQSVEAQILWLKQQILCCKNLIGDVLNYSPTNYTQITNTVVGHLEGIDIALATLAPDGVVDNAVLSGGVGGLLSLERTVGADVTIDLGALAALMDVTVIPSTPTAPFVGTTLQTALDEIYAALNVPITGDDLGDHEMDQNLDTNGFWISDDGTSKNIFIGPFGVGINQAAPSEQLHIGTGNFQMDLGNILVTEGNLSLQDGQMDIAHTHTAVSDYEMITAVLSVAPSANQSVLDQNIMMDATVNLSGANTIGISRNLLYTANLTHTGSLLGYIGNESRFFVTSGGTLAGGTINMFSDMFFDGATVGFNAQDIDGFQSYMKFGAFGTVQDANGMKVDLVHGVAGTFSGQNITGLNIANVDAGLTAGSWQNRYSIYIADTVNDAGVAVEDMVIKSVNTKPSEFAGLINHATDLSGSYTVRSLVDKAYVDGLIAGAVPTIYNISGGLTVPTTLADGANALNFTGTGTRSHTSGAYSNIITGADFSNTVGALGTTTGYKWGAGSFTGSLNPGFNIMNNDATFENVFAIYNAGALSAIIQQVNTISSGYANTIQVNNQFITISSDDGINSASMVVDGLTSPRVAASISDGTKTGQFFVKPGEALLESVGATSLTEVKGLTVSIVAAVGGKLQLQTEYVTSSNVALAVGQVPVLQNVTTGEVEYAVPAPWLIGAEQTGTFSAVRNTISPIDVSAGVSTVNPYAAPVAGNKFMVSDSRGNAATFNITIDFTTAVQPLHAAAVDYVISVNGETATFRYIDATIGWIKE